MCPVLLYPPQIDRILSLTSVYAAGVGAEMIDEVCCVRNMQRRLKDFFVCNEAEVEDNIVKLTD